VDAEDFAGDDGGYGEAVEDVDEGFPDFYGGATFTFVVEAVHYTSTSVPIGWLSWGWGRETSCDVCAFVVSAEEEKVFWPADF